MTSSDAPIATARCSLVALTPDLLATMLGAPAADAPFEWPSWWPDDTDRAHLHVWAARAKKSDANVTWGARAIVDERGQMLGHAGFHEPPRDGTVEIGYTVFPEFRGQGVAREVVTALLGWAAATGLVSAVAAVVDEDNRASLRVLNRVGGFEHTGTGTTHDGAVELVFRRRL